MIPTTNEFFPKGHPAANGPMLTLEQQMLAVLERIEVLQIQSLAALARTVAALEALRDRPKPQAQTSKKG